MAIYDAIRTAAAKRSPAGKAAEWQPYGGTPLEQYRDAMNQDRTAYAGRSEQADQTRNRYLDMITGGQDAANTAAQGMFQSILPQFQQALQGADESLIARGVTGGDTETGFKGRMVGDFSRNLANAMAGNAMNLYGTQLGAMGGLAGSDRDLAEGTQNRYLDLVAGRLDYETQKRNRKAGQRSSALGGATGLAGIALGGYLGNRGGGGQ